MASIISRVPSSIRRRRGQSAPVESDLPPVPDAPEVPEDDTDVFIEMTLQEHLEELRSRIMKAALAVMAGIFVGVFFAFRVIDLVADQANVPTDQLQVINPTEPFTVYFKVVLYIAVAVAMPVLIWQFLMFVAPGLTGREKRIVFLSVPFVFLMFVAGVSFAFFVLVPRALEFLSTFGSDQFEWNPRAEDVLSFYMRMMLGVGLIFQLPIIMVAVSLLGVMNARRYARGRKFALILGMVAAAVITPTPDPFNMMLVAIPTYGLYEIGIILTWFVGRRRQRAAGV
jgi:sec-independent protein translocase protein TatC